MVIYDADDKPCKNQLIDVVKVFRNNLACVQARLNYYNAYENLLTSLFAIEYAIIF
ncbi:MAG: hypothetical protein MRQ09_02555 [Candidatus Midichloria sp.]|nr:hypothetical protein [Candidatus Midichloria sp.]